MSAPQPPPDQPVRPLACGNCDQDDVEPHCSLPRCPWSRCGVCGHISGFVLGRVRHFRDLHPEWHRGRS